MRELHKFWILVILVWFPLFGFLLAYRIIFLAFDILKIDICSFRDNDSEHKDYMDMAECTPSTRAPMFNSVGLPGRASHAKFQHSAIQRGHQVGFFPSLSFFILHLFQLYCKTFLLILSIVILEGWWHHQQLPSLALLPELTVVHLKHLNGCPGPSSSFVR